MHITFTLPKVKGYIQVIVITLHIRNGNFDNLFPQSTIPLHSALELKGCFHCFFFICRIFLGLPACGRINLLKLCNRHRCFLRIFAIKAFIKIYKIRVTLLHLGDDQSHLQTPVSHVNVTDHLVSDVTGNSLHTFTNNCRTEMSDMKRLCHVRSAVIHNNRLLFLRNFQAKLLFLLHLCQIVCQKASLNL